MANISGAFNFLQSVQTGTSTGGNTTTTLNDTGKSWTINQWVGALVTAGTVSGEIVSNTATQLTIKWPWTGTTPGSIAYTIYGLHSRGTSSGGNTVSTFNDTTKTWQTSPTLAGLSVEITGGTGAGQVRRISTNTATQLTLASNWSTVPDATSTYQIKLRFYDGDHITGAIAGHHMPIDKDSGRVSVYVDGNYGVSLNGYAPITLNSTWANRISFEANLRSVQGILTFWSGISCVAGTYTQYGAITLVGFEFKDSNTSFALNSRDSIESLECHDFVIENGYRPPLPSATLQCDANKRIYNWIAHKGPYSANPGFPGVASAGRWQYDNAWLSDGSYGSFEWQLNGPNKQDVTNSVILGCTMTAGAARNLASGKRALFRDCYLESGITTGALFGSTGTTHAGEFLAYNNVGLVKLADSAGSAGTTGVLRTAFNDIGGYRRTFSVRAIEGTANVNYTTARSDWDYIAGTNNASIDNIDTTLGSTSSASPQQFEFLVTGRFNPRTSFNKPYSCDNIVESSLTDKSVTITFDCTNGATTNVGSTTLSGTASSGAPTLPVNELTGFIVGDIIEVAYGTGAYEEHEISSLSASSGAGNITTVNNLANTHLAGVSVKRRQRHRALGYVRYGTATGSYEHESTVPPREQWPYIWTTLDQTWDGKTYEFKEIGHNVVLDDLYPSTTYYYQCCAVAPNGEVCVSSEGTFTTAAFTSADYPAVSNVRLGTIFASGLYTGTCRVPAVGNTKIGYAYDASDSLTGTYDGSERFDDLPLNVVLKDFTWRYNTTGPSNRTGALPAVREGHAVFSINAANQLEGAIWLTESGLLVNNVGLTSASYWIYDKDDVLVGIQETGITPNAEGKFLITPAVANALKDLTHYTIKIQIVYNSITYTAMRGITLGE